MALTGKKYESLYTTSGGGSDELSSDELTQIESWFDLDKAKGMKYHIGHPDFAPLVFQMQQMQDELDYLRTEISSNKSKATFPGFGTSSGTALEGNTSLLQLGTTNKTALAGNTIIPTVTVTSDSGLTVNFGNLKAGKTGATADLTITDNTGKSPVTYTAQLTLK